MLEMGRLPRSRSRALAADGVAVVREFQLQRSVRRSDEFDDALESLDIEPVGRQWMQFLRALARMPAAIMC